jgi:OmpA-OmpF porin, OOP family
MRISSRCIFSRSPVAALVVFAIAANANAADETGMFYFNAQYGYTFLDNSRARDDGDHGAFGFGYHVAPRFSVELNGVWGDFEGSAGQTLHQGAYSLDGLFVFGRENRVSPYITFGGGYLSNNFNGPSNWAGPMAQAGLGLLIDVGEDDAGTALFQLRPEVKYRHDWPDTPHGDQDAGDILINLGFAFNFGAPRSAPAPAPAPIPPAAPPPPPPPPPQPVDSDGDGVLDPSDRCPGTPRGVAVDATGCPRGGPVTLLGVEFASNSGTLTAASRPILDEVATDLKAHPRLKVEVQGHTDSRGADLYNMELSQRRADSVRDYLIAQGVSPSQLVSKGYGETTPISDNTTDTGRANNRRVVMSVLDNPGNAEVEGGAKN